MVNNSGVIYVGHEAIITMDVRDRATGAPMDWIALGASRAVFVMAGRTIDSVEYPGKFDYANSVGKVAINLTGFNFPVGSFGARLVMYWAAAPMGVVVTDGYPVVVNSAITGAEAVPYYPPASAVFPETFGAVGDGITDDIEALDMAVAKCIFDGGILYLSQRTYGVSRPWKWKDTGVTVWGVGIWLSIIKALPGFVGTAVMIVGKKDVSGPGESQGSTLYSGLRGFTIDGNDRPEINCLEWYGLRDGSYVDAILFKNWTNSALYTNCGGDESGYPTSDMCQGNAFGNIHALISQSTYQAVRTKPIFDINGMNESSFVMGKALGSTAYGHRGAAIRIGNKSFCRGVSFINVSVGNLNHPPQTTEWAASTTYALGDLVVPTTPNRVGYLYECTNIGDSGATEPTWDEVVSSVTVDGGVEWTNLGYIAGIEYGIHADQCWDEFTTLEEIAGKGCFFNGNYEVSLGGAHPNGCRHIEPRIYNSGVESVGNITPAVEIIGGTANYAHLRNIAIGIQGTNHKRRLVYFSGPGGVDDFNNTVEINFEGNDIDQARGLEVIKWAPNASASNIVRGFGSTKNARDESRKRTPRPFLLTKERLRGYDPTNFQVFGTTYVWVDSAGKMRIKSGPPGYDRQIQRVDIEILDGDQTKLTCTSSGDAMFPATYPGWVISGAYNDGFNVVTDAEVTTGTTFTYEVPTEFTIVDGGNVNIPVVTISAVSGGGDTVFSCTTSSTVNLTPGAYTWTLTKIFDTAVSVSLAVTVTDVHDFEFTVAENSLDATDFDVNGARGTIYFTANLDTDGDVVGSQS